MLTPVCKVVSGWRCRTQGRAQKWAPGSGSAVSSGARGPPGTPGRWVAGRPGPVSLPSPSPAPHSDGLPAPSEVPPEDLAAPGWVLTLSTAHPADRPASLRPQHPRSGQSGICSESHTQAPVAAASGPRGGHGAAERWAGIQGTGMAPTRPERKEGQSQKNEATDSRRRSQLGHGPPQGLQTPAQGHCLQPQCSGAGREAARCPTQPARGTVASNPAQNLQLGPGSGHRGREEVRGASSGWSPAQALQGLWTSSSSWRDGG